MARGHFNGGDAIGGGVGDIHEGSVGGCRSIGGCRAEDHRFRYLRPPSVDDFKAMRTGDVDVEFAAIRLEQQRGGSST